MANISRGVSMPPHVWEELKEEAKEEMRSVSGLVRWIVSIYLSAQKEGEDETREAAVGDE